MLVSHLDAAQAFVTLDGLTICELAGVSLLCCCAPPYSDDDTVLTGG